jgi:RNA polymerase sigma-70 factor, ECF subfamily
MSCEPATEIYSTDDPRALVAALIAGSADAWQQFERRFAPTVLRCISSVTSRFRRMIGEDDVREIYGIFCLRLLEGNRAKLRAFDPERGYSLASWLGMIATQTTFDYLRRQKRALARELPLETDAFGANDPDPYEVYWQRQRRAVAQSLLELVTDRDRELLALLCADQGDTDQIAQRLGISPKTVYTKKHKLMRRLASLAVEQRLAA